MVRAQVQKGLGATRWPGHMKAGLGPIWEAPSGWQNAAGEAVIISHVGSEGAFLQGVPGGGWLSQEVSAQRVDGHDGAIGE